MAARSRSGGPPLAGLALLFFCSGISGLMYQVLWLRMLAQVFGVTAYAASTVLASFMAGLALGSLIGGSLADRVRSPLRWFGGVEIGIAVAALLTPWWLGLAQQLYAGVHAALPDSLAALTLARFVCSFAVLMVPTVLMGATLPLVVRSSIVTRGVLGPRVGLLYAVNAGGAITGAVLAGFYLIGTVGLSRTFAVAATVNVLVGVGAWLLPLRPVDVTPALPAPALPVAPVPEASRAVRRVVLAYVGLSGLAALALEVIWFRVLVLFLPATTYAFTTMLATVLGGITIGSLIATPMLRRERDWPRTLAWISLATALAVLASLIVLAATYEAGWRTSGTVQASIVAILPSAILMGLAFPVAMRIWVGPGDPSDPVLARRFSAAYAVNMLGAILGATIGGFVLLPLLGSRLSLALGAATYLLAGLALVLTAARHPRPLAAAVASTAVFAWLAGTLPDPFATALTRRYGRGEIALWREEGVQTTVAVHRAPGNVRVMYLDGLHQANDSFQMVRLHRQIGLFPMAIHPDPREVLVVGLGGGATPGAVAQHAGTQVEVVELSASVVRGAALFSHVNYDVLNQPNVRMRVSDGRNFLLLSGRQYDVITADIIQPQHAGAGMLYSREYFSLARQALAEGGVMLQWIGQRPEVEYRLIMRTFLDVFPNATLWNGGTLMVGTLEPLRLSRAAFERKLIDPATRQALEDVRLESFDALLGAFSGNADAMRAFVGDGPILTDDHPRIEYHRSLPRGASETDLSRFIGAGRERLLGE
jgi:spermidine synthase